MVQSPSWAADWLAASQEIPRISRNPKVHYRTQYQINTFRESKRSILFGKRIQFRPQYGDVMTHLQLCK